MVRNASLTGIHRSTPVTEIVLMLFLPAELYIALTTAILIPS